MSFSQITQEKLKTTRDANAIHDCPKLNVEPNKEILLVNINRTYNQKYAKGIYKRPNICESTRKHWCLSRDNVAHVRFVLGVYCGIVCCVVKVEGYKLVDKTEDGVYFKRPRYCFEGVVLEDSPYLDKDVSDYPFGRGGVVRYI